MVEFAITPEGRVSDVPVHDAARLVTDTWPEANTDAIELNMLFLRCFRMVSGVTSVAIEETGLTLSRASTVSRLYLAGERGLTIGEIAMLQDLTQANASKLVDGLVRDGYVEKSTNPEDGRSIRARLTALGNERAQDVGPFLYSAIGDTWSVLNAVEKRVLIHLLSKLRMGLMANEADTEAWLAESAPVS